MLGEPARDRQSGRNARTSARAGRKPGSPVRTELDSCFQYTDWNALPSDQRRSMLVETRTLLDDPHPQCQRLRPLDEDEAAALRASRERDYINSQPVELFWPEDENDPDRGKILDGFHRLSFLLERNQLPPIVLVRTDAPRLHVSRKQNVRRNLPPYERACDMLEGYLAEATGTVRGQPDGLWPSGKELAAEAGVSERTASTALKDYRGPTKTRKPTADAPPEPAAPERGVGF